MATQELALALCRVSSLEQLDNNSLSRQREAVLKAATELNLTIHRWWSGSVSSKRGTNIDRQDLREMLECCRKDKRIKYVIVDEVDRFMRSMLEIGYFLVEFKKLGVKVVFASQPNLKTDTATDTLLLMLEAFKAEGSNEERQHKSIAGQTKALMEGRYPFSPKPGYKRGYERGIQEIHPVRGPALREVLVKVASRLITPTQGLIELNKSDFMRDGRGHAAYKMDKFRKIVTDSFYAGIVEIDKQVKIRNEKGLHEPLISLDQHEELIRIMDGKKKTQSGPRKNGNPKYPLSNHVSCELCREKKNGRYVGYDHGNGSNPKLIYEKYRCRGCARYLTRDELHNKVEQYFKKRQITKQGTEDLIKALNVVWKEKESQAEQDATRIKHKIEAINADIARKVEAVTDPDNASIKQDILDAIARKKDEVVQLDTELSSLKTNIDTDKERFLRFALGFAQNMGRDFMHIAPEHRLRCKQILFPAGFYLDENNKVYTPEISPIYGLAAKKKDAEASIDSHLVRVQGL